MAAADDLGGPESHGVRHMAIIMDGNGRWANARGLPRIEGHRAGAEAVRRAVEAAGKFGLRHLTLYAFSTENWKRPRLEVMQLMRLLQDFLDRHTHALVEKGVRLRTIGRTGDLPKAVQRALRRSMEATAAGTSGELILALSYGARAEIANAAARIASDVAGGLLPLDKVDEAAIAARLYAPDIPDPDIIVRTSGEMRLSNFLLWQASYAELWFTDTLWPDFDEGTMAAALRAFASRSRRFGGAPRPPPLR